MSTDLDDIRGILMSTARYAEPVHRGLDRLEIAQKRSQIEVLRTSVSNLSTKAGRAMLGMEQLAQQAEQNPSCDRPHWVSLYSRAKA